MRSLSDLTNEQLMELIEEIKKKNGGETDAKNWSHEDIERLLELTDRGKQLEELDRERDGVPEEQSASNEEFSESEAEPTVEETEEPDEVQAKDAEEAEIVIEGQTGQSVDSEIDDDEFEAESLENAVKFLSGEMKTEKEENIKSFDISEEHENTDGDDRLKSIMTDVAPIKEEKVPYLFQWQTSKSQLQGLCIREPSRNRCSCVNGLLWQQYLRTVCYGRFQRTAYQPFR